MQSPSDSITNLIQQLVLPPDSLDALIKNAVETAVKKDDLEVLPFLVQILDTVIWPLVVLIILWAFKQEFGGIFSRAKSLKMGASGIEIETFEKTLQKTKSLANVLATAKGTSKSFAPPPDPFGPTDPKMIVTKVQLDLDRKLRKKASTGDVNIPKGLDIHGLNTLLKSKELITTEESLLVDGLSELAQNVLSGYEVTTAQAQEILDIYNKLP